MIGPRKPSRTSFGARPQWSTWAWVSSIASKSRSRKGLGSQFRGQIRPLLIHAAIDQHAGAVGLEVVLRSGDLTRGPQELQLHGAILGE